MTASTATVALLSGCDLAAFLRLPTAPGLTEAIAPLVGKVLDADGKPAASVAIQVFRSLEIPPGLAGNAQVTGLLGNAGAGLAGNAGAGLIGNAGSGLAGSNPYRRVASVTGTTDAEGGFFYRPDSDDAYNFEAGSGGAKAWKLKVSVSKAATASLTIKLSATGAISGTVTPAGTSSIVLIPGSTYWTYSSADDGKYELTGIPAGKFELRAAQAGYKAAAVPGAGRPDPVQVKSGETTKVDLELEAQ